MPALQPDKLAPRLGRSAQYDDQAEDKQRKAKMARQDRAYGADCQKRPTRSHQDQPAKAPTQGPSAPGYRGRAQGQGGHSQITSNKEASDNNAPHACRMRVI